MRRFSMKRSSRRRIVRRRRSNRKAFQGRSGYAKRTRVSQAKPYTPGRTKVSAFRLLGPSSAMPAVFETTQRYVTNMQLNANTTTGFVGNEVYFRLNDMYQVQPSGSPGVHQPLGWNEMRQFYINSCVYKVDIQIRLIYTTGNNPSNAVLVQLKSWTNNFTPTGLDCATAQEQPNVMVVEAPTDDRQPVTKEMSVYIADILGVQRSVLMNDNDYWNNGNSKVFDANTAVLGISVGNWNQDVANNDVRIVTTITQHVRWMKAANVGPS